MGEIAKNLLGDASKWNLIAKANPTVDPGRMKIGTKLRIPSASPSAEGTAATGTLATGTSNGTRGTPSSATTPTSGSKSATGALASGATMHTVAKSETLSSIAQKYYGNSKLWKAIAKANPKVDANKLSIGTKLSIPSKAMATGAEREMN